MVREKERGKKGRAERESETVEFLKPFYLTIKLGNIRRQCAVISEIRNQMPTTKITTEQIGQL